MAAIGIDIGASYIRIGIYRNDGVDIIPDEAGNRKIPAYVAFTEKERFIGDAAKNQAAMNPKNTVYDIFRMIGRNFSDSSFQNNMKLWSFTVIQGKDDRPQIRVEWKGATKLFYPEEILAMLLLRIKKNTEKAINQKITEAVFSTPCNFTLSQIESLRCAAKFAGIVPLDFISAPILVSLTFGFNIPLTKEEQVLVFDFGGGSLDIALMTIDGGMYEVMATASQPFFGGEDIDFKLMNYFADRFKQKYRSDLRQSPRSVTLLRRACTRAKQTLTISHTASVTCDSIFEGKDLVDNITQEEFDKLNSDLYESVLEPIKIVLKDSNIQKNQISYILLFGGSSRIPGINQTLTKFFNGKQLLKAVDREEAAAIGASIFATIKKGDTSEKVKDILLLTAQPTSLGIVDKQGKMLPFIPRNTMLPAKKSITFKDYDLQKNMTKISIFEGEAKEAKNNKLLESLFFGPIERNDVIDVTFDVDSQANFSVQFSSRKTKKTTKNVIKPHFEPLNKNIDEKKNEFEGYEKDDEKFNIAGNARNKLEGYCLSVLDSFSKMQREVNATISWIEQGHGKNAEEFERRMQLLQRKLVSYITPKDK